MAEITPFPNGHQQQFSAAEVAVSDPAIDPTTRLKLILSEVKRAADDLERQRYLCDTLPGGTSLDIVAEQERKARNAFRRWYDVQHQAVQLEQETRRRQLESLGLFAQHFNETRERLLDQFGDLGPHYEILVDRMAAIDTRVKLIEQSGRDVDPSEYNELHKTWLSYLNQLQKYTEAQKVEALTRQTQETVSAVMVIVEHRIANQNPQLWREIVADVRKAIETAA